MTEAAVKSQSNSLDRLRAAARTLFVQSGYHNTRPQDIVREAGVANGTFYIHFKDKREAFLDFAEQAQNDLLARYTDRLVGITDQRERWKTIFDTVVDYSVHHPGLLHAAFFDPVFIAPDDPQAWRLHDRMGHLVALAIGDQDKLDRLAQRYDVELISHALCGMLRHGMMYAARKHIDRDQLITELSKFTDHAFDLTFEAALQPKEE